MHPFANIAERLSKTTYVILLRDEHKNITLLADPGLNRPWSSKNKRLADFHAAQCNGEAHTWESAFSILRKEFPDFEKSLIQRLHNAAQKQTVKVLSGTKNLKPIIDSHGNPTA